MSEKQKGNTKENNREAREMDDETLLKMIRSGAFKHATNQQVFTDATHPPAPHGYAAASMMGPAPLPHPHSPRTSRSTSTRSTTSTIPSP